MMRHFASITGLVTALILALLPLRLAAQDTAALLADSVRVSGQNLLIAEGHVEVLYQGARLQAARIAYDRDAGRLQITGPLTLIDADGRAVILADAGALDADLQNGILQSARLVLDEQLQLAAAEIARVDGRYTQLYKTVASSCQVCAARPVPLWQIRAKRVIHDQQTRQLYFEKARFEIAGVPVLALPRLRLPDPTVKRATGFLVPSIRATSQLGTGNKLPYFVRLGDHADVTLTPYLSSKTRTMEMRARKAFAYGDITLNGAVSDDDILPGKTRAYLFGEGAFDIGNDLTLSFGLQLASDPGYLLDYGYSSLDRLSNDVAITRFSRDEYLSAQLINIRTLRASEIPTADELPFLLGEVIYERRFEPAALGGEGSWRLNMLSYGRQSNADGLGRDGLRVGAGIEWTREWQLAYGMLARVTADAAADIWAISQDSTYRPVQGRVTPAVSAELRWPLVRTAKGGAVQMLEPVAQIAWAGEAGAMVPNEDSELVEFDGGNLLTLSRYPGSDRRETGLSAAAGLSWSHYAPQDRFTATLAGARVWRLDDNEAFSTASGLSGRASDWLLGAHVTLGEQTALTSRNIIGDNLNLTKSETRLRWDGRKLDLGTTYTWVIADAAENRPDPISELILDGAYQINRHWTGTFEGRYDFRADQAASAGIGVSYRNECISLDLSVSRRFTSSSSLRPTTSAALSVSLAGFGTGPDNRAYRRQCGL